MRLDRWSDFPLFNSAVSEREVEDAMETVNSQGAQAFLEHNPDYFPCPENSALIAGWLCEAPTTRLNLELACRELKDNLKPTPPPEPVVVDKFVSVTRIADGVEHYIPSDDEAARLAKLQDDISLSDHARKARDRKLALLAGAQRRAFSNLPPGSDPKISV